LSRATAELETQLNGDVFQRRGNTKAQVNHLIDMGFDARARRDSNPQPSDP
jgi:hypothetical protein